MTPMHLMLALILVAPPKALSPEAGEHNTVAMRFYDAGQFAPAVDEFYAAYRAMPDARRDREGRELLLGSIRMTLLNLYDQTGEAAPLCRLQAFLQEHVDGLAAAFAGEPGLPELRNARARHQEVTQQLASFAAGVCEPPAPPVPVPAPVPVAAPVPPRTGPVPAPAGPMIVNGPSSDAIPSLHLKIAGGVTLGIGAALLGVMTHGIAKESRQRARAVEIRERAPNCPLTPEEVRELETLRDNASSGRQIAIGTGVAAAVMTGLGTALLVVARRGEGKKRWSAAPWWSPSGAGLTLQVRMGVAR